MNPGRIGRLVAASGLLAILASAGADAAASPAADSLLVLKDGRVFEGIAMERKDDALLLKFLNGDVTVPLALVEDFVVAGAALPEPASEEEKEKRAKGLVPFRGKWVPVAEREKALRKEIDTRRKAIEDYRTHSEWRDRYQFKTKNFEFESTQPPWQNDEYSELLEIYFKEFQKVWKVRVPQKWGKLKVCFYASEKDFLRTGGVSRGTLAYYRFVEPRELNFYYDRTDPAMSVSCLFHEANHYLTDLMDEAFQYPHWVNEAMAEYYGASIWDPVKKTMVVGGIQHGRLAEITADMDLKKLRNLRDMISNAGGAYSDYYWGWSFVHFLMETPKYRTKFMKFFADLAQAPDVARRPMGFPGLVVVKDGDELRRVFLGRMGLKEQDLDGLQKEWYEHIQKLVETGGQMRGFEEAGLRAYRDGYWRFRAPRLLKSAIDKGSRRGDVHATYAACLMQKGMAGDEAARDEALKVLENAVTLTPLDAGVWARRAAAIYISGNTAEADRMLALAREIDPEADFLDLETWVKLQAALKGGDDS